LGDGQHHVGFAIGASLQVVLRREGFEVQQAKDGPTARRLLGPGKNVDLIILDIMMPARLPLSPRLSCKAIFDPKARKFFHIKPRE
jgi:CheY-like chemotaxis protein